MAAMPATASDEPATTLPPPKPRLSFWTLFWAGLGFALLLLIVGLVSYWIFGGAEERFVTADAKRVEYREKVLSDRVSEDTKYLKDEPSWFDKGKGLVRVPIEEAITMTIPKLQADKPHAAYPLSKSPPQPAAAPTSPVKAGLPADASNNAVNPPSSNPTVGQPSPGPVAAPEPRAATAASSPVPVAPATPTPAPAPAVSPAPAAAPAPAATVAPTPFPTPTPVGLNTPMPSNNNADNPGNPPIPGNHVQPPAPTPAAAPTATPNSGANAEPLTTPAVQPSPVGNAASSGSTPTPAPAEPGATPGGTPR